MKAAALICLFLGSLTSAVAADCASIKDNTMRLACYDEAAKPKPAKSQPSDESVTPAMNKLRSKLDKAFLEAGMNITVMIISKQEKATSKIPQLALMGYMNRATVYQIITKTDLIRQAKEAGFQSLEMFSLSGEGHRIFDLSQSGQTCSYDLCFKSPDVTQRPSDPS